MPDAEFNFDGLVGPTHNYAGLSFGNIASTLHRQEISNPRQAALQGLAKMKLLAEMGIAQGVLPPQERPDVHTLRRLGFGGLDAQVLEKARREAPQWLAVCSSASSMWAANAATVAPSADTADGRVHLTAANLANNFHRAMEASTTAAILRAIFRDEKLFAHHEPLPAGGLLYDEGAANHTRLAQRYGGPGIELFTFGREAGGARTSLPARYPGRQTLEASEAIARLHQLEPARTLFVRQNPAAIDAGVFHNDVIAVGNLNVLFCHSQAWVDQPGVVADCRRRFTQACGGELIVIEVDANEVELREAVETYLFNSQLVTRPDGLMAMICPSECRERPAIHEFLEALVRRHTHPIRQVRYADVRQSMRNGGGPACLRLRVALTEREMAGVLPTVLWTAALHGRLEKWVQKHYREALNVNDLADPKLLQESRAALDELTGILGLGQVYQFQRM